MQIARLNFADISEDFYDRLRTTFSMEEAMWKPGDETADVAFRAGQQYIIEWIKTHAKVSSTSSV